MEILSKNDYSAFWDITYNWQEPLKAKRKLKCPLCGGDFRFKEYHPHHREYTVTGHCYRIDIWNKCCTCAHVIVNGVSVTEEYYQYIVSEMKKVLGRVRPLHILESIDIMEKKNGTIWPDRQRLQGKD